MNKNFVIALIALGVILLLIIAAKGYTSPAQTKTCHADADCAKSEVCRQQGPIVLDPVTKKPLTGKTCVKKDSVIPF